MSWTASDLPDLTGRTAVVTGANSGIGYHAAKELAAHGAAVVLACRNQDSARQAADRMSGTTRVAELDLASLDSVRRFAEGLTGPVDLLVNNAGLMTPPKYRETADGFEIQYGTNHLGHVALTARLLPRLLESPAPRVVAVTSIAHHRGDDSVLRGNPQSTYSPNLAYGNSKLANLLFARELQRRAAAAGSRLTATAAHPGVSATELFQDRDGMGANSAVHALAPDLHQGVPPVGGGGRPAGAVRRHRGRARLLHRAAVAGREPRPDRCGQAQPLGGGRRAGRQAVGPEPRRGRALVQLRWLSLETR